MLETARQVILLALVATLLTIAVVLAPSRSAPAYRLWEMRIRAAAVLMFLSDIRVGAFVSLPLSAIDIRAGVIRQWPELGVRTKFQKHATTYFLHIPELTKVVTDWDDLVGKLLPEDGFWFAPLSPFDGTINANFVEIGKYRSSQVRKDLRRWLKKVSLPYKNPHAFRHGHATYAIKQAEDVAQLKAIIQNLMHENISTTDGIYAILSGNDVQKCISSLGKPASQAE